jgi:rhamnosyltransferase
MRISVIIPTLNAASYLPRLLDRLNKQSHPPHEILVVDSASEDTTCDIARRYGARMLTIKRDSFDHGGTRNWASRQATGDIFVFMTQDALPKNEFFLSELIRPFDDEQVAAVSGRQVPRDEAPILEKLARELNYPQQSIRKSYADIKQYGIKTFYFTNVCSAVRGDIFRLIGGFPEPVVSNEDMIFAAKCILKGYAIEYSSDAEVIHSHNYSISQQFRRYFDIGASLRLNKWILSYAKAEGEGGKLFMQSLRRLRQDGYWGAFPVWLMETAVKFAGYRMGLAFPYIPMPIRRKMSMHSFFWKGYRKHAGGNFNPNEPTAVKDPVGYFFR